MCEHSGGAARSEPASAMEQAVAYLKAAASGKRLPPAQVLAAILALEKAKLPVRLRLPANFCSGVETTWWGALLVLVRAPALPCS